MLFGLALTAVLYYNTIVLRFNTKDFMRETVTISLPKDVKNEIDHLAKNGGLTRSDIIRASLSDYLFFQKFKKLRARLMLKAQARGLYTDQDIFDVVS